MTKVAAGDPLTDEDRRPWLDVVAEWIADHTAACRPGVVTCSALMRAYRDKLAGPNVVFVHLAGTTDSPGVDAEHLARHPTVGSQVPLVNDA